MTDLYIHNLNSIEKIKQLIGEVTKAYKDRYPELIGKEKQIFQMIFDHEIIYQKTLEKAARAIQRHLKKNNKSRLDEAETEYFRKQFGIPNELQEKYLAMVSEKR